MGGVGSEALESEELMYFRNLSSCGGFLSSASCEGDSRRLPEEIASKYLSTVGERLSRVMGPWDGAFGIVTGAAIVRIGVLGCPWPGVFRYRPGRHDLRRHTVPTSASRRSMRT